MEYWIYLNEEKKGPYTVDQLKDLHISASTLVWGEGMVSWKNANEVPELASLFEDEDNQEEATSEAVDNIEEPQQEYKKNITPPPYNQGCCNNYGTPSQEIKNQYQECPPTYLVWAVLSTLCCCFPLGVVAIIYGSNVQSKFYSGDYEGAVKYSERAALWVILSFVIGLTLTPLFSLLTM